MGTNLNPNEQKLHWFILAANNNVHQLQFNIRRYAVSIGYG